MTLSPAGHQFIPRRSSSSHQDAGLYSNDHEPNNPQVTNNTPVRSMPTSAGEILGYFNSTRPPLDFVQSHCNDNNHGLDINSSHNPPSSTAGQSNDPHLPHPLALPSSFLPAFNHTQSHHHQPLIVNAKGGAKKLSPAQKATTRQKKRPSSHIGTGSEPIPLTGSRVDQPNVTPPSTELASKNNHPKSSNPANSPLKKNGKPLAKCPFCGMTFKKLEHCQRHERTLKKSSAPAQPTQASPSSNSAPKQTSRNQISSPIRSSFDMLTGPGASQSSFASPPHAHKPVTRERGCSLSVLEHSSFPGHLGRDPSMISSGPRQSISLPLQRSQEQFAQPPRQAAYPFYHHQAPPSSSQPSINNLSSPSDSSTGYSYVEPVGGPRRGSWCPGGSNWNEFAPMPPDDLGPPPSTRSYRHQPQHLSLEGASWSKTLTNTFGLVQSGIGPVPLSAPPTCTDWGAPLIGSGAPETSNSMAGSFVGPSWETLPPYESRPSILPGWSGLGRLEEEEHIKLEPESSINSAVTSQLLLSSPSQPGSFDNENNCPIGLSSAEMAREPPSEANQSVSWSFPKGGTLSYAYTGLEHDPVNPAGFTPSDPIECFGNVWQTPPQNQTVETFHPGYWNQPVCAGSQDEDRKRTALNSNGLPTRNPWEENHIVELNF
ncbi:hypothetical protein PCASD_20882 [Puccinia coronata f. sp. avenae]|uniref:Uncharacterized protein n=1 Tax=Puccinia coronata f. sp. avenae TaxID=200324 RepID=A0A2N5TM64_9BASI|nr:hypothetical protein PCASD_20882 [Puccinia coronata f. sp. avenae]